MKLKDLSTALIWLFDSSLLHIQHSLSLYHFNSFLSLPREPGKIDLFSLSLPPKFSFNKWIYIIWKLNVRWKSWNSSVCLFYLFCMSVHVSYVLCVSGKRFPPSATCVLRDTEIMSTKRVYSEWTVFMKIGN